MKIRTYTKKMIDSEEEIINTTVRPHNLLEETCIPFGGDLRTFWRRPAYLLEEKYPRGRIDTGVQFLIML